MVLTSQSLGPLFNIFDGAKGVAVMIYAECVHIESTQPPAGGNHSCEQSSNRHQERMREHGGCRYLLLEDAETGDMLMPLIYMKAVFEANYSRKLSSLKHRLVAIPADAGLPSPRPNTYLYWQWAFEAPHNVKLLVRQELGEDNSPQVRYPAYTLTSCIIVLIFLLGRI